MREPILTQTGTETAPAPAARIPRRSVFGWITYDLASNLFTMGIVSMFFATWVREMVGPERADTVWGAITSLSYLVIFFLSPILGAMTDRARRRKPFLVASTLLCVGFTALLGRDGLALSAAFFVVANLGYLASLQFYDALLPEVSTEENRGRIGGMGVAFGYIGSFIPVTMGLVLGTEDKPRLFLLLAALYLLLALPCFLWVRERGNPHPEPIFRWSAIRESARQTVRTLRSGSEYPGLTRFLVGRVFYTDAINTVIIIMMLFTVNVAVANGFTDVEGERQGLLVMGFALFFAVSGGFFWGWMVDRSGPRNALHAVLFCWMAVFSGAALVGLLALPLPFLYAVASAAGFSLGGVWASDRIFMLRLTPPHRIGEFYGLYGMVGRFSAITGPLTWLLTFELLVRGAGFAPLTAQGVGILVLMVELVVAYWILRPVSDRPARSAGAAGPHPEPVR
jgi:MFS transporter, UMF1 family